MTDRYSRRKWDKDFENVQRWAVRVHGRGVVTEFNGKPITERETAEAIVRSIDLMYGDHATIEKLVLSLPVSRAEGSQQEPK